MGLHKIILVLMLVLLSQTSTSQNTENNALYNTIMELDSTYFKAYNECDMKTQTEFYDADIEFYHDKGGLATDKAELLKSIEKNICGKVTRTLLKESVEVYPIKDFGAVQTGMHKFYNNQEPDAISKPTKFIVIWKKTDSKWLMSRVISLH
tara:strand:- start:5819 stop:6271 length:453 start_codon:yes stop_codon:yes gene_type:complete